MPREVVHTDQAPSSPMWSQGVKAGDHVFVSGMVGIDATTGKLAGETIQEQTLKALANCLAVVEAAGGTADDVVDVTVLLANPDDFQGMNEVYASVFPTDPPARNTPRLGPALPGVRVSIRMTAVVK
ncbi:RidA family protein [Ornithinimicrobium cryptoxanthini]|uniref:RidA family protein n=1 Tax=Ornithinimicrobium cryptoxanthini TaxID=2934161 RepID=UPI0021193D22|nr:Rid family hydrolase [Ornithinimicrobium cryptoxanthini]